MYTVSIGFIHQQFSLYRMQCYEYTNCKNIYIYIKTQSNATDRETQQNICAQRKDNNDITERLI